MCLTHAWPFTRVLGSEINSSCLCRRHIYPLNRLSSSCLCCWKQRTFQKNLVRYTQVRVSSFSPMPKSVSERELCKGQGSLHSLPWLREKHARQNCSATLGRHLTLGTTTASKMKRRLSLAWRFQPTGYFR